MFLDEQPLLIFGGSYSNLEATLALKVWAESNGFLPEQCINTGDIVAYCANPFETIELIREWGVHSIQGNVEQSLANDAIDCGCGFESGTTCDTLSRGWFSFANDQVTQDQRRWFAGLPESLSIAYGEYQMHVLHGAVSNINRFMYASLADNDFNREFQLVPEADVVIAGHSGLPFTKSVNNKIWHNSGALGMPANDGTSRVWFSTLEVNMDGSIDFQHHHLDYDAKTTSQRMQDRGLNQGYHTSLLSGLWPSMDVLPAQESQQQGIALTFG